MPMVEVNGGELYVEDRGAGPPALVLHGGLGIDHVPYRRLDPLAAELRLVYLDHRGNGRSTREGIATTTMADWAADVAAVARSVGGGEPVILIGHSYGGFIAQETAVSHGDVVRALVLVATTPGQLGTGEEPAPEGPPMPEEFARLLSSLPTTDAELERTMADLAPVYAHRVSPDVVRSAMAGSIYSAAAMKRGFEELSRWSSVDRLSEIAVPTLLVAGRHDAFTAWPQSERIASRLADAEVVILAESGHLPWLDEPDAFFAAVTGWLRRRELV